MRLNKGGEAMGAITDAIAAQESIPQDDAFGFDFDIDFSGITAPDQKPEPIEEETKDDDESLERTANKHRSVQIFKTMSVAKKMKLLSEAALDDALDWHLEEGVAYHCMSMGDVDSLTYLRHIVRQQPLEYLVVSTWCMAMEDALEIAEWVERGMVGRVDFYVGEIFKNGYRGVRDAIETVATACGGRVARFRNHSKIMAGFGRDFGFAIESSANINTNPRAEQTVITVDDGLALFYKEFFDEINSFDAGFEKWKPYKFKRGSRYARTNKH